MSIRLLALGFLALLAGCKAVQVYDGERRSSEEVARISGSLPFTAGAPVSVILRQVDERTLSVSQTAVEVLPGPHRLLVDCRIAETGSVTRHSIEVEVAAGRHYRLRAETGPGLRCSGVTLEAADGS
ncbi:MAG TPA: hypothetical protein VF193_05320 [Steroidobacter sp.]